MSKMTHGRNNAQKCKNSHLPPTPPAFQQKITQHLTLLPGGTEQERSPHSTIRHTARHTEKKFLTLDYGKMSQPVSPTGKGLERFSKILFLFFFLAFFHSFPSGKESHSRLNDTHPFIATAAQALCLYGFTRKTVAL
ncbi:hypothetical protein [Niabella aurantiaca]|uniref:hypothetical protein n=1 Tax=Niabella aurantiaca TaxID=379900 RepID=UPI0005934A22|nr:hypothetical protein [Niabella aurantiaca]